MKTYMYFCTHGHSHPLFVCLQDQMHVLHTHICIHVLYACMYNSYYTLLQHKLDTEKHELSRVYVFGTRAIWRQHYVMAKKNTRDCTVYLYGTRTKKMWISRRLFIRFWTCIYDYIPCFMRSMSTLVCRSLTSWCHWDNDWRLMPCRAQPCHFVVR